MISKVLHHCGWDMINNKHLRGSCCVIEDLQNNLEQALSLLDKYSNKNEHLKEEYSNLLETINKFDKQ